MNNQIQNRRGELVPAIPLPLYGFRKQCVCKAKFFKERNYQAHYALVHIVLGEQAL